eukprot:gb/GEZN01000188.1/.p1 GENE.gb/GEZN01000188.1/~~gb/GEZN01000188.1/.p1  ORF type:complete len:1705 (+),score=291.18 gb/GEZN01000188.1/:697-5811(+)
MLEYLSKQGASRLSLIVCAELLLGRMTLPRKRDPTTAFMLQRTFRQPRLVSLLLKAANRCTLSAALEVMTYLNVLVASNKENSLALCNLKGWSGYLLDFIASNGIFLPEEEPETNNEEEIDRRTADALVKKRSLVKITINIFGHLLTVFFFDKEREKNSSHQSTSQVSCGDFCIEALDTVENTLGWNSSSKALCSVVFMSLISRLAITFHKNNLSQYPLSACWSGLWEVLDLVTNFVFFSPLSIFNRVARPPEARLFAEVGLHLDKKGVATDWDLLDKTIRFLETFCFNGPDAFESPEEKNAVLNVERETKQALEFFKAASLYTAGLGTGAVEPSRSAALAKKLSRLLDTRKKAALSRLSPATKARMKAPNKKGLGVGKVTTEKLGAAQQEAKYRGEMGTTKRFKRPRTGGMIGGGTSTDSSSSLQSSSSFNKRGNQKQSLPMTSPQPRGTSPLKITTEPVESGPSHKKTGLGGLLLSKSFKNMVSASPRASSGRMFGHSRSSSFHSPPPAEKERLNDKDEQRLAVATLPRSMRLSEPMSPPPTNRPVPTKSSPNQLEKKSSPEKKGLDDSFVSPRHRRASSSRDYAGMEDALNTVALEVQRLHNENSISTRSPIDTTVALPSADDPMTPPPSATGAVTIMPMQVKEGVEVVATKGETAAMAATVESSQPVSTSSASATSSVKVTNGKVTQAENGSITSAPPSDDSFLQKLPAVIHASRSKSSPSPSPSDFQRGSFSAKLPTRQLDDDKGPSSRDFQRGYFSGKLLTQQLDEDKVSPSTSFRSITRSFSSSSFGNVGSPNVGSPPRLHRSTSSPAGDLKISPHASRATRKSLSSQAWKTRSGENSPSSSRRRMRRSNSRSQQNSHSNSRSASRNISRSNSKSELEILEEPYEKDMPAGKPSDAIVKPFSLGDLGPVDEEARSRNTTVGAEELQLQDKSVQEEEEEEAEDIPLIEKDFLGGGKIEIERAAEQNEQEQEQLRLATTPAPRLMDISSFEGAEGETRDSIHFTSTEGAEGERRDSIGFTSPTTETDGEAEEEGSSWTESKLATCQTCDKLLTAHELLTDREGLNYCQEHFTAKYESCCHCDQPLRDEEEIVTFPVLPEEIEEDEEEEDEEVTVLLFHSSHFQCFECGTKLNANSWEGAQGHALTRRLYCSQHYDQKYGKKCAFCDQVVPRYSSQVSALGAVWHADHLCCAGRCKRSLKDLDYAFYPVDIRDPRNLASLRLYPSAAFKEANQYQALQPSTVAAAVTSDPYWKKRLEKGWSLYLMEESKSEEGEEEEALKSVEADSLCEAPFCNECYGNVFSPLCHGCGLKTFDSQVVSIASESGILTEKIYYHLKCHKCAAPGCEVKHGDGVPIYMEEDKLLCQTHFEEVGPPCTNCSLAIQTAREEGILIRDQPYHARCVRCAECDVELGDEVFVYEGTKENKQKPQLVCKRHLQEKRGPKCTQCLRPIQQGGKVMSGLYFHDDCIVCKVCGEDLGDSVRKAPATASAEEQGTYCEKHYAEVFTNRRAMQTPSTVSPTTFSYPETSINIPSSNIPSPSPSNAPLFVNSRSSRPSLISPSTPSPRAPSRPAPAVPKAKSPTSPSPTPTPHSHLTINSQASCSNVPPLSSPPPSRAPPRPPPRNSISSEVGSTTRPVPTVDRVCPMCSKEARGGNLFSVAAHMYHEACLYCSVCGKGFPDKKFVRDKSTHKFHHPACLPK